MLKGLAKTPRTYSGSINAGNFNISANDSGEIFTNEGATGAVVGMLPKAIKGLTYGFALENSHSFGPQANAADTIRMGNAVSAAGGTALCAKEGGFLFLYAITNNKWMGIGEGSWIIT